MEIVKGKTRRILNKTMTTGPGYGIRERGLGVRKIGRSLRTLRRLNFQVGAERNMNEYAVVTSHGFNFLS